MEDHQFRRASVNAAVQERFELTRETLSDGSKSFFSKTAMDQPSSYIAFSIVVLSCILYIPFLRLPLLPDDYLQITLGRKFGPIGEWHSLLNDPLFRNRATSLILTYWTDLLFPFSRLAFGASSFLLHAANGLLVYALGTARSIGWRLSAIMAIVFVLQERPHEAVIWYAALPELLVLFFALSCLLLWIRWLRSPGRSIALWSGVLTCFLLAQFSKESAVAAPFMMMVLAMVEQPSVRRVLVGLFPVALVAAVYVMSILWGRDHNHHFLDGTFALQSGFIKTLLFSAGRGLWIWGWVSLATLKLLGVRNRLLLFGALCWIVGALLPYSFLTYMETVPSRHHYLASVGYSLITALALQALLDRTRNPRLVAVCMMVIGLHHTSYLWMSKYHQFEKRSEPIEAFIRFLHDEPRRPVTIHCSDYYFSEVRRAAYLRWGEAQENLVLDFSGGKGTSPSYCLPGPL
jgi:hypothetical protein